MKICNAEHLGVLHAAGSRAVLSHCGLTERNYRSRLPGASVEFPLLLR